MEKNSNVKFIEIVNVVYYLGVSFVDSLFNFFYFML